MSNGELPDNEKDISEGEIYIQEFFEEQKIESVYNKKIDFFKYDNKAFRMADFYLPKYDLYVEFLGRWNKNEEERVRYREKMRVYYQNNLPCVYFFPENLGNIKYHFNYRAMKELKDKKKRNIYLTFVKSLFFLKIPGAFSKYLLHFL